MTNATTMTMTTGLTARPAAVAARDHWDSTALDLDAYLARIGAAREEPSAAALDRLMTAHARAIPFENVDVVLGTHPGVALPAVVDKLVDRRRGGYCYEHVTLFAAALDQLGYAPGRFLARIAPDGPGYRSHATLVVPLEGTEYLADVGFGGAMWRPMPLRDGAEVRQAGGQRHRTVADPSGWTLQKHTADGWIPLHHNEGTAAWRSDFVLCHHYVSTHPHSPFTGALVAFAATDTVVRRLNGSTLREEHADGRVTERILDTGEVEALLPDLGLELSAAEAAALHERLR